MPNSPKVLLLNAHRLPSASECPLHFSQLAMYWLAMRLSAMISRFSALRYSAPSVKLNEPVMTMALSTIITLLCAMACLLSIQTGMLARVRNVALVYFSFHF